MSGFWSIAYMVYETINNWLRWYLGGFDSLLSSLTVFVVMGGITNGMCAVIDHRLADSIAVRNVFQNIQIFILVGIGNVLDVNILKSIPALRTTVILFYLSVKGSTLLENTVFLGLPVPEKLKMVLEKIRQKRLNSNI